MVILNCIWTERSLNFRAGHIYFRTLKNSEELFINDLPLNIKY